tara:strand:- start:742 stop:999 length:258 start_codon:yes stop_codon:yes gene_type:complete
VLVPTGQKTTVERIALYYAIQQMLTEDYAFMREKNATMWKEVFIEDIGVVEGMQAGRMAPSYDGGNFLQSWTIQHIIFINGWRGV